MSEEGGGVVCSKSWLGGMLQQMVLAFAFGARGYFLYQCKALFAWALEKDVRNVVLYARDMCTCKLHVLLKRAETRMKIFVNEFECIAVDCLNPS